MICVIIHLFYSELLNELYSYVKNIKHKHDIYITIPYDIEDIIGHYSKAKEFFPNSYIKLIPNKGLDIGAFLNIIQDIDWSRYWYCFKLHTKLSPNNNFYNGNKWRKDLLDAILCDERRVEIILDELDGSKYKMAGSAMWKNKDMTNNGKFFKYWCDVFGYNYDPPTNFIAGTMFACTTDIIKEIADKKIKQDEFDDGYAPDGRKEHAFERFFGKIVQNKNGEILYYR